ncbi:MAG: acetate--CoA ligase [Candidatus Syntrophonatronum acetioxidans]|uniref:Acetyl-coenzyme A synthetase n=1 Tax=Candidatus Syntrophonatronum acetioxidans TaxID=1795816 RepID=A0A424YD48_9FIRM|nr:MAG: acetate--CoA ligase [Candidatus Syntrophonatronum acetioxidans]
MSEIKKYAASKEFAENAHIKSMEQYQEMYKRSIEDPEGFWAEEAEKYLDWFKKWDKTMEYDYVKADIKFFQGGKLNAAYNCLDRHLNTWKKNRAAIIWQGEPEEDVEIYTYQTLHREVSRFANVLKKNGIKKGDRVCIYMGMIPQLVISMLACVRIGAIHSIVFGGFSPDSIRDRVLDSECKMVVTADWGLRAGKQVPLKNNVDEAMVGVDCVEKIIVFNRYEKEVNMEAGRDLWWHEEMAADDISDECPCEEMDAEDPLFILYTSGSTGKPKGVLHTTGGYMLYTTHTFKYIFDIHEEDTWWCTADIGWVTGHSYITYGPLSLGATSLMFEGVPNYPAPDRFWQVVEKFKVTQFYTAPTALRAMIRDGDKWPEGRDLSSLKLLGTVGEPINPEVWRWYHRVVGKEKCPIVDTWWQTETGGILITPLPGAIPQKPGSATLAYFGVEPAIFEQDGTELTDNDVRGYLVIKKPWPGQMRTVYGDHERFRQTYFDMFPGVYLTGDNAARDEDGYYWILGRIDDVINISGHRMGTAEVESALVSHAAIAEAAVVGFPHEIKGEGIFAYCIMKEGFEPSDELRTELRNHVRKVIGPIASPDFIVLTPGLPKTRSGKIMRRILRKVAAGEYQEIGDTTTLADPSVVELIVNQVKDLKGS